MVLMPAGVDYDIHIRTRLCICNLRSCFYSTSVLVTYYIHNTY